MKSILSLLFICLLISCSSIPNKIQKEIDRNDFLSALELLNKEGVGKEISGSPKPEAIEARNLYSESIYGYFKIKVSKELEDGLPKKANETALEALFLCSWHEPIIELAKFTENLVKTINEIEKKWIFYSSIESINYKEGRKIAKDIFSINDLISDSPKIISLYKISLNSIIQYWVEKLRIEPIPINKNVLNNIYEDLSYFPFLKDDKERIILLFDSLNNLPFNQKINSSHIGLIKLILSKQNDNYEYLYLNNLNEIVIFKWENWVKNDFQKLLNNSTVSFETLNIAEYIYENGQLNNKNELVKFLKSLHLQRARLRSNQGKDALLSLLHLSRYESLNISSENNYKDIKTTISNSLNTSNKPKAKILIEANNYIEPEIFKLIQLAIFLKIQQKTRKDFEWEWYSKPVSNYDIKISIKKADYLKTTYDDLRKVSSEYLSHFEDVPNPIKSYWESQLSSAEFNVNMAQSSYNRAVSSHNIYPTQYSLSNVNNSYTNYKMAVDNYNRIVNTYNSTPSTISRPVYLPYQFTEGDLEHGWKIIIDYEVNNNINSFKKNLIDTDFFRVGSKYNDRNENYRKDDYIDIDLSTTNSIEKLSIILDDFFEEVSSSFCNLNLPHNSFTDGYEREILDVLYHPFGFEYAKNCSSLENWIFDHITKIRLPEATERVKVVKLEKNKNDINTNNLKEFISFHERHICEIETDFSTGSGVLISKDGLILTCAHVLIGRNLKVNFIDDKTYIGETVFIDEINDVALIKAKNFFSPTWANIQIDKTFLKGHEVITIGNPALGRNIKNKFGVTKGIVSNPSIEVTETKRMVCDITVASGSSGGPIFSFETGEIIGIVTAVGEAGFNIDNDQISSSGYLCLSAPSNEIQKWLNIIYTE